MGKVKTRTKEEIYITPMTINQAWQGRKYKTPKYADYIDDVLELLPENETIEGYVAIYLTFYLNNRRFKTADVDNFIKPIFDILVKKGYIEDDRKVLVVRAEKLPHTEEKIKIEIIKL